MAKMSPKARRGLGILAIGAVLAVAVGLTLSALEDTVVYFYDPSTLADKPLDDRLIRVGGLVVEGSVSTQTTPIQFSLSDGAAEVKVVYSGILPDLFREGQGIIAEGRFDGQVFTAETVLAKHDETYMPKEIADSLKDKGLWKDQPQSDNAY